MPLIPANEFFVGAIMNRKHGKGWIQTVIDEEILGKIFSSDPEYAINDFEPISLTPDVLKECGYSCIGTDDFHEKPLWEKEKYLCQYCEAGHMVDNMGYYGDYSDFGYVEFLHQLQMMYWLLTNEKLIYANDSIG